MGDTVPIQLDVKGDLNTSDPITNRPSGSLVTAKDLHPRYWGPREGLKSFTRIWESPGTAAFYDAITFSGGSGESAFVQLADDQFSALGTKFTVDVWFQLQSTAYASADDAIGVYEFNNSDSSGFISIVIYGPNHASAGKILASIATSATTTSADATVSITSASAISVGSAQTDKQHVRFVRDGKTGTLYINGVSAGSTTSLSVTHGINGRPGRLGRVYIGSGSSLAPVPPTATFKGRIYAAILRDGAFTSQPIEASLPVGPMARGVRHYTLGRRYNLGGAADHLIDLGPFGLHARVGGSPSYTSSNDNAFPAPAMIQGIRSWTTRTNRTATTVMAGGILSTATAS